MILHSQYSKIGLVTEPLVLANASIEERVNIMRAKRTSELIEALDSDYMYLPVQ